MPLTCDLRIFNHINQTEGEFNLPVHIIDLGSLIGVAISCLVGGVQFGDVLSTLDFYARFLRGFKFQKKPAISTICMAFDGGGDPFWFGSSLVQGTDVQAFDKDQALQARQNILSTALGNLTPPIILPLVPPRHQRTIGMNIRSHFYTILKVGGHQLPDNQEVAKLCVELLQAITQPSTDQGLPWMVVSAEPNDFGSRVEKIFKEAGNSATASLLFVDLKKLVEEALTGKGAGQQYGHCAETYPLLFMFRFVSLFLKLWMEVSLIPLRRRIEPDPSEYEGLARSVSGFEQCLDKFYAGSGSIACNGSGKCKVKCVGEGECTVDCGGCRVCACEQVPCTGLAANGCQRWCEGGRDCKTVCKQNVGCQTRCYGGGKTKCETTGTSTPCEKRNTRCEVCQIGDVGCEKDLKCWTRVCESCMDSQACCSNCDSNTDPPPPVVVNCLECGDFLPLCENCQALITKLGYTQWNKYLNQRHQRLPVNHYML